jgi:hypothetical protein
MQYGVGSIELKKGHIREAVAASSIKPDETGHQVGDLQPLTYPRDVNAFIAKWFQIEGTPEKAGSLIKEIAHRPDLRQSATVPLLLAFYCIAAGSEDNIPQIRPKLYDQVVRQLLAASWHGGGKTPQDQEVPECPAKVGLEHRAAPPGLRRRLVGQRVPHFHR